MNSLVRRSFRRRCYAKRPTNNGANNRRLQFMSSVVCETPWPSHEYVTKSFAQSMRAKQWPLSSLENPWVTTRPDDAPLLMDELGELHGDDVSQLHLGDALTEDVPRQRADQSISLTPPDEPVMPDADPPSQQSRPDVFVPLHRQDDEEQKSDPRPAPRPGGITPQGIKSKLRKKNSKRKVPTNFQVGDTTPPKPFSHQDLSPATLGGETKGSNTDQSLDKPSWFDTPTEFSNMETTNHLAPSPKPSAEIPTPKPSTELATCSLTSDSEPLAEETEGSNTDQSGVKTFWFDTPAEFSKETTASPTHLAPTPKPSTELLTPKPSTELPIPKPSTELPTPSLTSDSEPITSDATNTSKPWFVADETVRKTTVPPIRESLYARPPSAKPSVRSIYQYMHKNDQQQAMRVYRECRASDVPVHAHTVKALFRLSSPNKPFDMYELLKHYRTIEDTAEYRRCDGDINAYVNFYERLCYSTGFLDSTIGPIKRAEALVQSLVNEIRTLDREGREKCYPTFVSALVGQKWVALGPYAGEFYNDILREELKIPEGWHVHILSCSRFNRQRDIDYADIMRRSVDAEIKPDANVTLRALNNLYPFDDTEGVEMFLNSILKLREFSKESVTYAIDIHTLELIGAAAARKGNSDVNLLIWNVLDSQGSTPTVGMYENTTTAFACNPFTYKEAFTVLYEMENYGFTPSRAFIRTLSTQLRKSGKNLAFAIEQLRLLAFDGKCLSVSALNVLLSAAAERGEVHRTLDLYAQFDQNRLKPDVDTFSFVFESLGKLIRWRRGASMQMSQKQIEGFLMTADTFIQRMEDHGIEPSHHVIRDYVEFLCHVDQVDTANSVVFGAADEPHLINSKTVHCVMMANARAQKFDVAREIVATFGGAHQNRLMRIIGLLQSKHTTEEVPEP